MSFLPVPYMSPPAEIKEAFSTLEKEGRQRSVRKSYDPFEVEKDRLVNKLGFWKDLLSDIKAIAVDLGAVGCPLW